MRKTGKRSEASPSRRAGKRGLAERWARAALRKILTPEDWKHYVICEEVLVSGRLGTYVVTPGYPIIFQPEPGSRKRRACLMKVVFGEGKVPPSDDVLIKVLWLRHNEKGVWASVPTATTPSTKPKSLAEEGRRFEFGIRTRRRRLRQGGSFVGSAILSPDGTLRPICIMRRPRNRPKG